MPWYKYIFKEFSPVIETLQHDPEAFWGIFSSNIFAGLGFLVLGVLCLTTGKRTAPREAKKLRVAIVYFLGLAFIGCALSRFFSIYCLWHNYAIINAILGNLTGLFLLIALCYTPVLFKELKKYNTIEYLTFLMEEIKRKIEELQKQSDKIK